MQLHDWLLSPPSLERHSFPYQLYMFLQEDVLYFSYVTANRYLALSDSSALTENKRSSLFYVNLWLNKYMHYLDFEALTFTFTQMWWPPPPPSTPHTSRLSLCLFPWPGKWVGTAVQRIKIRWKRSLNKQKMQGFQKWNECVCPSVHAGHVNMHLKFLVATNLCVFMPARACERSSRGSRFPARFHLSLSFTHRCSFTLKKQVPKSVS